MRNPYLTHNQDDMKYRHVYSREHATNVAKIEGTEAALKKGGKKLKVNSNLNAYFKTVPKKKTNAGQAKEATSEGRESALVDLTAQAVSERSQ